eukprot:CAMPEP_0201519010 /NCGR_PEP_ID=MMETSP0161_2-20130828/9683_1 /ASSEMBLY_ACC=CAM_ASM_000251 /TAXON_ID=180227 /ORGANISM="Neoparamoeba aestuarina, Strain SoJaBio B1-5/56/2" /LENGTH=510 /DNA_ID=CAMNT_0047916931 /DNA_START=154 /DNA_END=1683 /DNA_ORIENTATION=+
MAKKNDGGGMGSWLGRVFVALLVVSLLVFVIIRVMVPADDYATKVEKDLEGYGKNVWQKEKSLTQDDLQTLLSSFKKDLVDELQQANNQNSRKLDDTFDEKEKIERRHSRLSDKRNKKQTQEELIYRPARGEEAAQHEGEKKSFDVIHPNGPKPRVPPGPRPKFVPGDDKSGIYIAIATFRDKECAGTMLSLYKKAAFPERVYVGLIQQISDDNILEDCLHQCTEEGSQLLTPEQREEVFTHLCPRIKNHQITDVRIPFSYGKGVMYARHNAQWLIRDQEFAMMMDAHSEFVMGWDSLMIANWNEIENEMAVLSTYPKNFQDRNDESTWDKTPTIPQLCRSVFRPNGIPRHQSAIEVATDVSHISPFWGACFSFSKSHAWRRVMFDPYSYFAFDPEEFSYGIRLWTHGYDMYTPSYNYIYHQYYGNALASKYGKRDFYFKTATYKEKAVDKVNARIRYMIGGRVTQNDKPDLREIGHYSLGDVRSLEDYLEFTSIDVINQDSPNICNKVW